MDTNYFITITGLNYYYDKKPFEIDRVLKLTKEPDNDYDGEAIRAELPFIGAVGYVANSVNTVFKGTVSAGRLYDHIGDYAYAQVLFITHSSVIAIVLSPQEVEKDLHETKAQEPVTQEPKTQTSNEAITNRISKPKIPIGF